MFDQPIQSHLKTLHNIYKIEHPHTEHVRSFSNFLTKSTISDCDPYRVDTVESHLKRLAVQHLLTSYGPPLSHSGPATWVRLA